MASSVNLAVTSDTLSEPLLITINCTIISTMNMMVPMTRLPPPTNLPNVATTLPAYPSLKISFVDETLSDILKIVVNNSIVGNAAISSTSFAYNELNNITSATIILNASNISSNHEGIEIIKNKTAASIYMPINKSFFFSFTLFLLPKCNNIS